MTKYEDNDNNREYEVKIKYLQLLIYNAMIKKLLIFFLIIFALDF